MPEHSSGAQRASSRRIRSLLTAVLAALLPRNRDDRHGPGGPGGDPQGRHRRRSRRWGHRVTTRTSANKLADQARSYGASVTKVYSPNATWSRVYEAAKGANLLIYLGHGNGWPSPYAPFDVTSKDGMGLNRTAGNGNSNTKYFGEYYMAKLALAKNAVVVLNRLCYASGNNEWGAGNPTKSTAIKRVDNYGYGFLRAGAKAVYASGITERRLRRARPVHGASAGTTLGKLFWADPSRTGTYKFAFTSVRTAGREGAHGSLRARPVLPERDRVPGHDRRGLARRELTARLPRSTRARRRPRGPAPFRFAGRAQAARERPAPRPRRASAAAERRPARARRNRAQANTAAASVIAPPIAKTVADARPRRRGSRRPPSTRSRPSGSRRSGRRRPGRGCRRSSPTGRSSSSSPGPAS